MKTTLNAPSTPAARHIAAGIARLTAAALLIGGGGGCAPMTEPVRQIMERPVDCATAVYDMKDLEKAKVTPLEQGFYGIGAMSPPGALLNVAAGHYPETVDAALGNRNRAIEAKIDAIRTECGLPASPPPGNEWIPPENARIMGIRPPDVVPPKGYVWEPKTWAVFWMEKEAAWWKTPASWQLVPVSP